jgi:hypothetical protein
MRRRYEGQWVNGKRVGARSTFFFKDGDRCVRAVTQRPLSRAVVDGPRCDVTRSRRPTAAAADPTVRVHSPEPLRLLLMRPHSQERSRT